MFSYLQSYIQSFFYAIFLITFMTSCTKVPDVSITPAALILKDIEIGSSLKEKICINNTGQSDIFTLNINTSCGCTIVSKIPNILKVNEKVDLDIVYNAPQIIENFKQKITIEYDGYSKSLPIIGNTTKTFDVNPKIIQFDMDKNISYSVKVVKIVSTKDIIESIIPVTDYDGNNIKNFSYLFDYCFYTIKENEFLLVFCLDSHKIKEPPIYEFLYYDLLFRNGKMKRISIPFIVSESDEIKIKPQLISIRYSETEGKWKSNILEFTFKEEIDIQDISINNIENKINYITNGLVDMKGSKIFLQLFFDGPNYKSMKVSSCNIRCNNNIITIFVIFRSL